MSHLNVIKYGTSVLQTTQFDSGVAIDHNVMEAHGKIIDQHSSPIIMVSSGAVGFGQVLMNGTQLERVDETTTKRILAELGQPALIEGWRSKIPHRHVLQKLVTYHDLKRETLKTTVRAAIENGLVYVFNFNDGVDDAELKPDQAHEFGDNDHLAAEVAKLSLTVSDRVRLILVTSAEGLMVEGETCAQISTGQLTPKFIETHCRGTSTGGTGGMASKLQNAIQAINHGVGEVFIINGKAPQQLQAVLNGELAGTKITL